MIAWKESLVSPTTPIREALRIIDRGSAQIALVVDKKGRLLGTTTDGDVRRGILKGISLQEPVSRVMNPHPIVAESEQHREAVLQLMKQKKIHQLPITDARGILVGVEIIDELLDCATHDNWVVLMAGGLGSRLHPLTEKCPKPLLNVGKKPILETILENFIEYGYKKFFISVNYKNAMLKKYFGNGTYWGAEITYLHETERLGTAGSLSLLPLKPKDPVFVMNADVLTKVNFDQLLKFHKENQSKATMCVREYDLQVPYGVVRMANQAIKSIDEKPVHRFFVNAGLYVLNPEVLTKVSRNKPLDMPQLFERMIQLRRKVVAFPIREYWIDIGRLDDYERANGEFTEVFGHS